MAQLIAIVQLTFWVAVIVIVIMIVNGFNERKNTRQYNAHHKDLKKRGLE